MQRSLSRPLATQSVLRHCHPLRSRVTPPSDVGSNRSWTLAVPSSFSSRQQQFQHREYCQRTFSGNEYLTSCCFAPLIHTPLVSNNISSSTTLLNSFRAPPSSTSTQPVWRHSSSSSTPTDNTRKDQPSLFQKLRNKLRTLFGTNDESPRSIQERKDIYWIILAVAHRKLRMEHQQKLIISDDQSEQYLQKNEEEKERNILSHSWQKESMEQNEELISQAASQLDESINLNDLSMTQLRGEMQKYLEPQIVELLNVACFVEEEMISRHDTSNSDDDDEDEEYMFNEKEAEEYREILLSEYREVCQSLKEWDTVAKSYLASDDDANKDEWSPAPFLSMKNRAISTLLTYYGWWPVSESDTSDRNSTADSNGNADTSSSPSVDEFGFCPNKDNLDIVPAMRYYHVRNLVRSYFIRSNSITKKNSTTSSSIDSGDMNNDIDNNNLQRPHFYHSILSLKSTIPSAGRGVYIDGFAPAGTVLAFFPGKVWPKEQLASASLQTQMQFSENDPRHQLSMRYDDILIDSRKSPYTVVNNMWALAHIVNHPPPPSSTPLSTQSAPVNNPESGEASKTTDSNIITDNKYSHIGGPNCVTVPINFTKQMCKDHYDKLRPYIPNEYEVPPQEWAQFGKEKVVMHGMGLVTLRDVKNEELFYDYRLSPDNESPNPYPQWYHVCDKVAIQNRWQMDS